MLIPKEKDFDSFVKFRGISLLSVMSKFYMACLMELYAGTKRPSSWSNICSLGFRANHSCGEIIGAIAVFHRAGYVLIINAVGRDVWWTFSKKFFGSI